MWRQWAVGDVITRLQNKSMANPESMQPELPPEFAWCVFLRLTFVGGLVERRGGKKGGNRIGRLGPYTPHPQNLFPQKLCTLPPKKNRYAQSQGVQTFQYGGKRWNRTQARCMFDLAQRPMMFFQTEILNLPGPRIDRPTFVDFGFEDGCVLRLGVGGMV